MTVIFHIMFVTSIVHYVDQYHPVIVCSLATNATLILDYVILAYFARDTLKKTNYLSIFEGAFTEWKDYFTLALPSAFIL